MSKFGHFELILFIYLLVLVQYITSIQNFFTNLTVTYVCWRMKMVKLGIIPDQVPFNTFNYSVTIYNFCTYFFFFF